MKGFDVSATTTTNEILDAALAYAERGWRVVPLHPRDKRPRPRDWPNTASDDPGVVRKWWREVPTGNVGVALGSISGIIAIDIDSEEGHQLLAEMAGDSIPVTCEMTTGKGSRLLFAIPDWLEIEPRNGITIPGYDGEEALRFQGKGGQCVMPPSVHPGDPKRGVPPGRLYTWVEERSPSDIPPAPMPGWLIDRMCHLEQPAWADPQTHGPVDAFAPGADFNRRGSWDEVLAAAGAKRVGTTRYWTRPGKDAGVSASLGYYRAKDGTPALYVWSGNWPGLSAGKCYDLFGFITHTLHGGDFQAAARALAAKGYGTPRQNGRLRSESRSASSNRDGQTDEPEPIELDVSAIPWPDPIDPAALHGLAGDVVRAINPHTEADPVAILAQFLVAFGNMAGRKSYYRVESSRHFPNLFAVLVGQSGRARKGTSWQRALRVLERGGDEIWARDRILSGLSSGEGLIWEVRDSVNRRQPIREHGRTTGHESVEVDPGIEDKRLLVIEEEFASVLAVGKREGNILGSILRNAWDTGKLGTLTKSSPARSTGAHISIISHITRTELAEAMTATQAFNGFLNRFLWFAVRRSKMLPFGGAEVDLTALAARLYEAYRFASFGEREVWMSQHAREVWATEYAQLTADRTGLSGAVTSRAEAQTIRLALVYALLDCSESIELPHLRAALAVERYVRQSAAYVFGAATGDPLADEIRSLLSSNPNGVSQNDIVNYFGRHRTKPELERALGMLVQAGLARSEKVQSGGRPRVMWHECQTCEKSEISEKSPEQE